jgi:hypothetical protein
LEIPLLWSEHETVTLDDPIFRSDRFSRRAADRF